MTNPYRHTFQYLDHFFPTSTVNSLDEYFKDLDVMTYMVEGSVKHPFARAGYHTFRAVAKTVEAVAYAVFILIKYTALCLAKCGSLCVKGIVLFVTMPLYAKKRFFPSDAQLLERRIDDCNKAIKEHHFSKTLFIGKQNEISHDEKKELLTNLIEGHLGQVRSQPIYQELIELLKQVSDGDLTEDLIAEKRKRILEIINLKEFKSEFPKLPLVIQTYLHVLDDEKKFEQSVTKEAIEKDFRILLKHPALLKRDDVVDLIDKAPKKLKDKLIQKRISVMQRFISLAHKRENEFIATLSQFITPLDLEELKEKYSSEAEKRFINQRIEYLETQLEKLEQDKLKGSFVYSLLALEKKHLEKQQEKLKAADEVLADLNKDNIIDEANEIYKSYFVLASHELKKRLIVLKNLEADKEFQKEVQEFSKLIKSLPEYIDQENTEETFNQFKKVFKQLQAIEMNLAIKGKLDNDFVNQINSSLAVYQSHDKKIAMIKKESTPWKPLSEIQSVEARENERRNELAKDLVYMVLETKPECQIPLLILQKDVRSQLAGKNLDQSSASKAQKMIFEAAQKFVDSMTNKYLEFIKSQQISFIEFSAVLQSEKKLAILQDVIDKEGKEEKPRVDFTVLSSMLNHSEDLDLWYAELQKIWIEHMPREQEEQLNAIWGRKAKEAKMAELFGLWFEKQTGKRIHAVLSFAHIQLPNSSVDRDQAIQTVNKSLRKSPKFGKFLTHTRQEIEESAKLDREPQRHQGFDPKLVGLSFKETESADIEVSSNYVSVSGATKQFENIIKLLEDERRCIIAKGLDFHIAWVKALVRCSKVAPIPRAMIIAECFTIINLSFKQNKSVPREIRNIFLDEFSIEREKGRGRQTDFKKMNNMERSTFLSAFLMMIFTKKTTVSLTEIERSYLVQLCSQSSLPNNIIEDFLSKVIVDPLSANDLSSLILMAGQQLQASSIGLEGVEEATLQKSFQQSNLPAEHKTRTVLDAYRARNSNALSFHLLNFVFDANSDLTHDQQREAIARALIHAFEHDSIKTSAYIIDKKNAAALPFKDDTLAPPLAIFYADIMREVNPDYYFSKCNWLKEGMDFNEMLIQSKNANQMLMGYARIISALTAKVKYLESKGKKIDDADHFLLLKSKIAYQHLKKNYFDQKKLEAVGFLKIETDKAEMAMATSTDDVQKVISNKTILDHFTVAIQTLPANDFANDVLQRELTAGKGQKFEPLLVPGFISLGERITIDAITGVIYNDGRQQVCLPARLQNHPAVRKLGIHNFPYTWEPAENAFVYYTSGQRSIPQIVVKEIDGIPVIQRRINASFIGQDDNRNIKFLQYVAKEQVEIPNAVLLRMGIEHFWLDRDNKLYGFDSEGNLVVLIDNINNSNTSIKTNEGESFFFVKSGDVRDLQDPALQHLCRCFNASEILVSKDYKTFFIPAVGLKVKKEEDAAGAIRYRGESKGMASKYLEIPESASTSLVFKNKINPKREKYILRQLKEVNYRRQLAFHEHSSRVDKHKIRELDKRIHELEQRLVELEDREILCTLEDQSYNPKFVKSIINKVPSAYRRKLHSILNTAFPPPAEKLPYKVFPIALKFLEEEMVNRLTKETELDQIPPLLQSYQEIQKEYEEICNRTLEVVFFKNAKDGSLYTRDLTGVLTLMINQLKTSDNFDAKQFIKELAKYPLTGPISASQLALIKANIKIIGNIGPDDLDGDLLSLQTYLNLMIYQHSLFKVCDLATTTLSDKEDYVKSIEAAFDRAKDDCIHIISELENEINPEDLPKELAALWKTTQFMANHDLLVENNQFDPFETYKAKSSYTEQLHLLASQSVLERLSAANMVRAVHKDPKKELSNQQHELSSSFYQHSPKQVEGFYFEKMGYFNFNFLCEEFKINPDTQKGLYGLTKESVRDIFNLLKNENYIKEASSISTFYCLTSVEKATTQFNAQQIRALLAPMALTEEQIEFITDRIKSFLFRAMQSGFDFSFKNGYNKEIDQKLKTEKETHTQSYLEAEAVLKRELVKYNATMTDLKYALLSGNYTKFINPDIENNEREVQRLTNAMIRYMFHKTEAQHIENILKAPLEGERNKIQLLQTRRNYSIDLLFKGNLSEEERKEQIMQRAYLAFEEDYGNRCNLMQIRMFRSLMLDISHDDAIDAIQARMGFGKTALLPLLAIVRVAFERKLPEEEKHLVRYIVPKAVIEDNTSSFNQRLSAVLGKNVIQDRNFARYQIDNDKPEESFKWIILDLENRLKFYKDVKKSGNVLIQWPEIRCSMEAQDLDFGEMIIQNNLSPNALKLCVEAKKLLVQIRSMPTYSVFDELDDTQDVTSREVNFTRGQKVPIPQNSIRPLEQVISYIEANKSKDWTDLRARAAEMVVALCKNLDGTPIIRCPDAALNYLTDRRTPLNNEMKTFLSGGLLGTINQPNAVHTENDSLFFLIRMVLLDNYILDLITSKQPNTHFGVRFAVDPKTGDRIYFSDPDSQSALLISVPYEGTNNPKGLSIFDNTEVAAITTIRYYLSKETNFSIRPHLDFLLKQMKKGSLPDYLLDHYLNLEGNLAIECRSKLKAMAGMLDPEELKAAKEAFFKKYMDSSTKSFRKFFASIVVATQIRADEACAKSDRYERGSMDDVVVGCSGTVGDTSSYFTKQAPDSAADGTLSLDIMGRDNNSELKWLTPPGDNEDYLENTIKTLLDSTKENTRGIVDIAGICKSRDGSPETVIEELWKQLQGRDQFKGIEGIVYYGKDNVKRLYKGVPNPSPCTTAMELAALDGKRYFSFYKQKNGRGSDIKQANGTHVLVTMDENVTNSDAKQAILRFRGLANPASEQTFSFAAMPNFSETVHKTLKSELEDLKADAERLKNQAEGDYTNAKNGKDLKTAREKREEINALDLQIKKIQQRIDGLPGLRLQTKDVANYLRIQEKNNEEKNAVNIFRKELKAHVKEAAGHLEAALLSQFPRSLNLDQQDAYIIFLEERNKISQFVERSINTLYLKYGTSTRDQKRNVYITEQRNLVINALNDLFDLAQNFADRQNLEIDFDNEAYNKDAYIKLIDDSIEQFKKRYSEHKNVQVSNIQSNMQAVAQAQAQALAEAQAEAIAEVLAENTVEVLERLDPPKVVMANTSRRKVTLDFIQNPESLTGVADFKPMRNMVRPDLRDKFSVSPVIEEMNIAAHFVLVSNQTYIFISQEEAELFEKMARNKSLNNPHQFALFDARKPAKSVDESEVLPSTDCDKQIPCAVLGDNGASTLMTATKATDLRNTLVTNVNSDQLLPHLTVKAPDDVEDYFKIETFGLGKDLQFTITINPPDKMATVNDSLTIRVESGVDFKESLSIPRNNKLVVEAIQDGFNTNDKQKFKKIHAALEDKLNSVLPQLKDLNLKKKALENLNRQDREKIANIKSFELTPDMVNGLKVRDIDYTGAMGEIGKDTVEHCEKIVAIQKNLKTNGSITLLMELQNLFNQFVSEIMLTNALNLVANNTSGTSKPDVSIIIAKDFLLTKGEWDIMVEELTKKYSDSNKLFETIPILDRVYGRIVHKVHGGDLHSALTCPKLDCKNMFLTTIPTILDVIPNISKTIEELKVNAQKIEALQREIDDLMKAHRPLIEALEFVTKMLEIQDNIEKGLAEKGLYIPSGEFFDQFSLGSFVNWKTEVKAEYEGVLPDYRHVVNDDMALYGRNLKSLTQQEAVHKATNDQSLLHVLNLAKKIENRAVEVKYVANNS